MRKSCHIRQRELPAPDSGSGKKEMNRRVKADKNGCIVSAFTWTIKIIYIIELLTFLLFLRRSDVAVASIPVPDTAFRLHAPKWFTPFPFRKEILVNYCAERANCDKAIANAAAFDTISTALGRRVLGDKARSMTIFNLNMLRQSST